MKDDPFGVLAHFVEPQRFAEGIAPADICYPLLTTPCQCYNGDIPVCAS